MQVPQPGESLGHYRVERMIGQGGMGIVYAATDLRLGRTVAIKVITGPLASTEEYRRRFHHEALAMSRVQSPWIVQIHDHDEVDGLPYIVTQFVVGTDLGSLVAQEGPLGTRRALLLCAQLARGLDDAHRAGVLHRDVKPGNVLLSDPGTPREHAYLCDFGIAVSDAASHHTATGMVAGTWSYLAPERTLGFPAAPASDLYAVGCVLWKCLTGSEPYVGTEVEIAIAHANAPVPQLAAGDAFTARLNRLLARILAKEPAQRHPDGASLAVELEQLAAEAPEDPVPGAEARAAATVVRSAPAPGTTVPRQPPPPPDPPVPHRRRRWPLVVAGVLVLAVVGGGAVWAGLAARDDGTPGTDGPEPVEPVERVTGDVDGDGLGDVVVASGLSALPSGLQGDPTAVSLQTLTSTGTTLGPATPFGTETGAPLLGDVDGDGLTDQVWFSTPAESTYYVQVKTATGRLWEKTQQLTATTDWGDLYPLLADVDDDGRDDLVLSNLYFASTEPGSDYEVTVDAALAGDETFGDPEQLADLGETGHPVTGVGDFDGDGDDDLFRATNTIKGNRITRVEVQALINDDGSFVPDDPVPLPTDDWGLGWFLAGDPDGDGDDELVVTNGRRHAVGVVQYGDRGFDQVDEWLAGSTPEKEWEQRVFQEGAPSYLQSLSDVDGDGDDDIVALGLRSHGYAVGVALSDGGSFEPPTEWGRVDCPADDCSGTGLAADVQPSID